MESFAYGAGTSSFSQTHQYATAATNTITVTLTDNGSLTDSQDVVITVEDVNNPSSTTSQIIQYGITWTFDKEYEYGQYANGDYWVLGPVNITDIQPGWDGVKHGSMINPMPIPRNQQAYDARLIGYDPSLLIEAPVTLNSNTSLLSTISWTVGEPGSPPLSGGIPRPALKAASVLTVVDNVPQDGSFRPPYAGANKPVYDTSALRKDLLPDLPLVANTPNIDAVAQSFERVWPDHFSPGSDFTQHTSPSQNMPNYGTQYAELVGQASLLLMLDEGELVSQQGHNKDTLLVRLVQLGIDLYEVVDNGGFWRGAGGLNHGRKWPIMFAGLMLDHDGMKTIGAKIGMYAVPTGIFFTIVSISGT